MNWKNSVALVTGASSGIGLAVARAVAARGGQVALVARSRETLERVARDLGPGRAESFPLDVTDHAGLAALPGRVVERFGRLDLLVNNAGVNYRGELLERTAAEIVAILDTNLVAPILLARAALDHLGRGGAVVNIASLAGKVPLPDEATYSASKSGLRAFSRALAVEVAERGIHVASVNPGPVDTGFFADLSTVPDIVFSQPMSSAEQIADAVIRAVDTRAVEIDVPAMSGKLATMGYLSPRLFAALRPALAKRGAKNKALFMAKREAR
jgi:short-subunit dehydrogenase